MKQAEKDDGETSSPARRCARSWRKYILDLEGACWVKAAEICIATAERDSLRNQWGRLPKSGRQLGEILAAHGIIDVDALDDPEGFDGGTRLAQLERAYSEIITGMKQ